MVSARITSVQLISTARGQRLYVVFKAMQPNQEMGLWLTPPRWLNCQALRVGDRVLLQRNKAGRTFTVRIDAAFPGCATELIQRGESAALTFVSLLAFVSLLVE